MTVTTTVEAMKEEKENLILTTAKVTRVTITEHRTTVSAMTIADHRVQVMETEKGDMIRNAPIKTGLTDLKDHRMITRRTETKGILHLSTKEETVWIPEGKGGRE